MIHLNKMRNHQSGFIIQLLLIIVVLLAIAGGTYIYLQKNSLISLKDESHQETSATSTVQAASTVISTLPSCNTAISDPDAFKKVTLPFTCNGEIGNGEENIEVTFSASAASGYPEEQRVIISRKGKEIFALGKDEKTMVEIAHFNFEKNENTYIRSGSFALKDVTYDGLNDLVVLKSAGAYNFTNVYYAYNSKTDTFDLEPLLEVTNESINVSDRTIESYYKGRGLGDFYSRELYAFRDGKYILMQTVVQDTIDFENLEKGYIRITTELRNGKMVETKRETISYKEVWGDQADIR